MQLLAGILHLGNVQFSGGSPAQVAKPDALQMAAYLLELDPTQLQHSLVHKTISTGSARHSVYAVPQNPDQVKFVVYHYCNITECLLLGCWYS